ncbi:MAG TPA: lysozyme [Acidobacteriaceae bacterium]
MQTFTYSDAGLALTKSFEGLRLEAYRDVGGVWTVGYGHTGPDLLAGMKISQADADALLRADLSAAVGCVNRGVTKEISQAQFDALVDFCFNVGQGNFLRSSLLRYVNQGEFESAAAQFLLWVNAGGKRVEGLARRRQAERAMFVGDLMWREA